MMAEAVGSSEVEEELAHQRCKREREALREAVSTLRSAVRSARREAAEATERAEATEMALFEERTQWSALLRRREEECFEDAVAAAVETAEEVLDRVRRGAPEAKAFRSPGRHQTTTPTTSAPPPRRAVDERRLADLDDVVVEAKRILEKLGDANVADGGAALKETLFAIAHPYGVAPPLAPTEALPATVACVDFALRAAGALTSLDAAYAEKKNRGRRAPALFDAPRNWIRKFVDDHDHDDDDGDGGDGADARRRDPLLHLASEEENSSEESDGGRRRHRHHDQGEGEGDDDEEKREETTETPDLDNPALTI